jgi:hypothetical protein
MRLADHISHCAHTAKNAGDWRRMTEAISLAQRFDIDRDACFVAGSIATSGIAKLHEALAVTRCPFPVMWVEWQGATGLYCGAADRLDGSMARVHRTGMLVEADSTGQRGVLSLAFSSPDASVPHISPLCVRFDFSPAPSIPPQIAAPISVADFRAARPKDARASDAVIENEIKRIGFIENARCSDVVSRARAICSENTELSQELQRAIMSDWAGEWHFFRALMVCLGSRNLMGRGEIEDVSKINKARARKDKPPLLSFSKVRIDLTRAALRRVAGSGDGGGVRQHIVRGHFKLRKSGVFWWSPFVRGDAQLGAVVRQSYEVGGPQ